MDNTSEQTLVDFLKGTDDEELLTIKAIDELIEEHKKSITDNRKEIKMCQQRIENLEYKKNKLKYGEHNVYIELANMIHDTECKSINCNFEFMTWDAWIETGFQYGLERGQYYAEAKKYLGKAESLGVSFRKAIKLYRSN